jgi:hypothetical protein
MNIVATHYKTVFFLDSDKSPRFRAKAIDKAINSAITDIVLDRYNNIRQKQKEYAFQTSQRLRDELATIVKFASALGATDNIIDLSTITDYWLLLSMKANISGSDINTIPVTYDELNIIEIDPYTRPSIIYPQRIYRIESSEGIQVIFGDVGALVSASAYYLKKPAKVSIGTEVSTLGTEISAGTELIAYIDTILSIDDGYELHIVNLSEEDEYSIPVGSTVNESSEDS